MAPSTRVAVDRRPERDWRRKSSGDDVTDRGWHGCRVDGAEVAQQPEHVGGRDVHLLHRFEVLEVPRTVHEHARKVGTACAGTHDDLDWIVTGSGNAPQIGRRTMRRECARDAQDCTGDLLLPSSWRPRQTGNSRCDQLQATIADCPVPRSGAHSSLAGYLTSDKSMVVGSEQIELWYPHAPHGCSEIQERERAANLGAHVLESGNVRAQIVI